MTIYTLAEIRDGTGFKRGAAFVQAKEVDALIKLVIQRCGFNGRTLPLGSDIDLYNALRDAQDALAKGGASCG